LIIEVAGKPARNLQTYMTLMANFKPGDRVPLTIIRNEQKMPVTVVPE
jgi:S1-C subfamily serine protease